MGHPVPYRPIDPSGSQTPNKTPVGISAAGRESPLRVLLVFLDPGTDARLGLGLSRAAVFRPSSYRFGG